MPAPPRIRVPALLLFALGAVGCTAQLSPEAGCFAEATVDYRAAWRRAEATRADLARGYGLHRQDIPVVRAVPCRVEGVQVTCLQDSHEEIGLPVAIDRSALEARLAGLETRKDALRPAAMAAAAPCGYGTWADGIADLSGP